MLRGGYKIIDLKNISLSSASVTIKGLHEAIESNYRKPLLLSSINIGGSEKADAFVTFTNSGNSFICIVYGYTITITNVDGVTAVAVVA